MHLCAARAAVSHGVDALTHTTGKARRLTARRGHASEICTAAIGPPPLGYLVEMPVSDDKFWEEFDDFWS